ncbi:hypothetical protein DPMN_175247 [Dreissena polymorpha]|uniref:Uncharacterized protein n=1 Tax=Dreissena polymorpha TaxID=45954 RepID=A0A9D4E7W1_DREPO|nr:hypothetical protein DPMN_175247 [Dreissena polymorpha]
MFCKFHKDWTINQKRPPPGGHVFHPNGTIFDLAQNIIGKYLLTKLHDDQTINIASRKNARPHGGHVFHLTTSIFILIQDIIKFYNIHIKKNAPTLWRPYIIVIKLLTTFHDDRTINVASRVLTRENALPPGGHVFNQPELFLNSSKISLAKIS